MNTADALATVELVEINWPRFSLADDTKQMWAQAIVEAEPHAVASDGYEAVRDLAAHQTWPPALAEIIIGIYGARLSRQTTRGQLPEPKWKGTRTEAVSFAGFIRQHPEGITPKDNEVPAFGEKQTYCDHEGEPEHQTFAEYLRLHPNEAERIKRIKRRTGDYIPAALEALLRGSNV